MNPTIMLQLAQQHISEPRREADRCRHVEVSPRKWTRFARLRLGVPMLAAVATLAAVGTPAAYGFDAASPGGGGTQPAPSVQHHSAGGLTVDRVRDARSIDWVIGVGTAGGITLLGAGIATSRRAPRRTKPAASITAQTGS